jgi:HEAT repeat protein
MSKSVILNFGSGSLQTGFSVHMQIINDQNQFIGGSNYSQLPANLDFDETYQAWRRLLGLDESKDENALEAGCATRAKGGATNAITATDFSQASEQFKEQINNWLGSDRQLEQYIRTHSSPEEEVRIIIQGNDLQLQRLPWHLWQLFEDYPLSEIAFSAPKAKQTAVYHQNRDELNILTILGGDKDIDVRQDLNVIESLPANVVALSKPRLNQISDELWDKPWNVLFFSGHSKTVDGKGIIHINDLESLTIEQLKNGLRKAIANGLQLAIFNSCDGLGLAWELMDLHIPQLIVMREPVPDLVAQKFAKHFLCTLAKGIPFYQAFRGARERLKEEFQDRYPHADWLPIAFQNPTEKVFSWKAKDSLVIDWKNLIALYQQKQLELTSNRLSGKHENMPLIDLGLVERKKTELVTNLDRDGSPDNKEQELVTNYDNSTFFTEVLKLGNTPKKQGRIAIAGEPGAGKTTFLQQIASRVLEHDWGIPIWLSLKDIGTIGKAEGDRDKLHDYIYSSWLSQVLNKSSQSIAEWEKAALTELFEQNNIWLLLDGLDEMRVTGVQSTLSAINEQLNNLRVKSPYRIVITCRQNLLNASSSNSLTAFDIFYTQKFNSEQVEQFIDNWFSSLSEYAAELKQQLEAPQYENINYLVANPLLLTMLCVIYEKRQNTNLGSLPDTRAALYREFIAYYYNWKNEEFEINRADKAKLEKDILGKLALWGLKNSSSRYLLLEEELKEFLQQEYNWQDSELYSWLFKLENTWLQKIGFARQDTTQAAYAFLHPTFQEYFAATAIDDYDFFLPKEHINKPVPGREYRIFDSQWLEVILFWCGLGFKSHEKAERNDFLEKLIEFKDGCGDWYHFRANFLAAKVIPEFNDCKDNLKTKIKVKLMVWFWLREFLLDDIAQINTYISDDVIINWLQKEKFSSLTIAAIEALKNTSNFQFHQVLFSLLQNKVQNKDRNAYKAIFDALRGTENPETINIIAHFLQHEDRDVCREALWALSRTDNQGNPEIINKIVSFLHVEDRSLCSAALWALNGTDNPEIINKIVPLLEKRNITLGLLWDTLYALRGTDDPEIINKIVPFLQHNYSEVRRRAVFALKGTDDSKIINIMLHLLKNDCIRVSEAVLYALEETDDLEIINKIVPFLQSSDYKLRFRAMSAISNIDNPEIINKILPSSHFEEYMIRIKAAKFFREKGSKTYTSQKIIDKIVPLLLNNESGSSESVCFSSIKVSKEIDDSQIIDKLILFLENDDSYYRQVVTEALKDKKNFQILQKILSHSNHYPELVELKWNLAKNTSYPKFIQAMPQKPLVKVKKQLE